MNPPFLRAARTSAQVVKQETLAGYASINATKETHGLSSILARRWRCSSVGTDSEHQHYQWRMASKRNPPGEPMTLGNMRRFGGRVTQAVRLAFSRRAQWSLNRPSTTK
jgi:hypothetical protein